MSFEDIKLTPTERKKLEEMQASSPAELVGKIRASQTAATSHLGTKLVNKLLKHYKQYDKGKTAVQGKMGGNY